MDNERSGGSTRRMDMTNMDDMGSDPLGESSADAVSAAEAVTSITVGGQDSGAMQHAQEDLQMSDAIGDDMIGDDGGAQDSASSSSSSSSASRSGGKRSGRIPDYALEMIAEHLRRHGHHNVSADELDSALDEAGFTVTPDPWHDYHPRSGPSLAEGSLAQQQQQRAGGFVSASPLGNFGSITLADTEAYRQSQQGSNVAQSSAVSVAPALSQISSDEGMGSNVASTTSTDHPQPSSGLEASGGQTGSDTATGPAAGMGDVGSSEPADLSAAAFGASGDETAMSDEGPVQPPTHIDFGAGDGDGAADVTASSFDATGDGQADAQTMGDTGGAQSDMMDGEGDQAASSDDGTAANSASGDAMGGSTMTDGDTMSGTMADSGATSDSTMTDSGAMDGRAMADENTMRDTGRDMTSDAAMGATDDAMTSSGGTGPVDAATTDMPPMPVTQVVGAGAGAGQQVAPHLRLGSGVEFAFGDKQEILIGREDPVSDIFPDVDLTGFGGEEGGVSRRHARIIRDGDTYLLEDLNSTNYTKLNGVKLIPKIPQAMRDGDHVSFGKVEGTFHLYK